ncbi:MAG: ATP-binding protein [Gammaproteobacteria bacterium]|nr:ATP-binding protein [Gammaproteobacteria bacterium]
MTGIKRNLEAKLNHLLNHFPAIVVLGARQVGKTTLAKQMAPTWHYFDLEKPSHFEQISHDPEFFFERYPKHLILDEAQFYPTIFNVLRGEIDKFPNLNKRFILTGSSSPDRLKHVSESLAGRVALQELGTLKVNEYAGKALSPFYRIFESTPDKKEIQFAKPPLTLDQVHDVWFKGGYPKASLSTSHAFYLEWMDNYFNTYINRDIASLFPKLNKLAYQRFITMLGHLSGTIINRSNIARAIEVSEPTVREYLTISEGSYLWRQLPSYENNVTKSIVKMPKGHLQDTGLLHYLLKIQNIDALYSHPVVGRSFESFVIEEIIKGLQASPITNWQTYYYRTRNGAEIDLILKGPFGILPIEIKYGANTPLKELRSLKEFIKEHDLPFGLLINQSSEGKWLTKEIFQLPCGWL